ncbi:hypothetical protein LJC20_04255 [Eubacteriales bacterium OttesenSCG-928-M02]|nr:hypothetical protein [Eubacteriales bacterium OttesenSCG-928-M02]
MARISREQIAHDLTLQYLNHVVDYPQTEAEKTTERLEHTLKDLYISYQSAYEYLLRMLKENQGVR